MIFVIFSGQHNGKTWTLLLITRFLDVFPQGEEMEDYLPAAEAQLTLVEAMELEERVIKDSFRVEREVEQWAMMPLGVSVEEEQCTEMEEVLEAEAATHGVLVGITSQIPVGVEVAHTTLVMSKVTIAVLTTRDISLCLSRGLAEEAFQHVSSQGSCPKALRKPRANFFNCIVREHT